MSEFRPLRSGRGLRADPRTDHSVMDNYDPNAPRDEVGGIAFDPAMVVGPLAAGVARRSPFGALAAVLSEGLASGDADASVAGGLARALGKLRPQMFIGKNAATWDSTSNAAAQKMAASGASPREIWSETMNWKEPTGQWVQEIDDSGMRLRTPMNKLPEEVRGVPRQEIALGGSLQHTPLRQAYPQMFDNTRVTVTGRPDWMPDSIEGGTFRPSFHPKNPHKITIDAKGEKGALGFYSHELQHNVANQEGLPIGTNPDKGLSALVDDPAELVVSLRRSLKNIDDQHNRLRFNDDRDIKEKMKDSFLLTKHRGRVEELLRGMVGNDGFSAYQLDAGEAMARATQARQNMNMNQRRAVFPEDSYDIPMDVLLK